MVQLFLAIDLNAIMPMEDFVTRAEELIDEIHAAPRADGVDQLFLPGEIEWGRLDRAYKEGIAFPADVIASLRDPQACLVKILRKLWDLERNLILSLPAWYCWRSSRK